MQNGKLTKLVIIAGGLLAAGYVFRILSPARAERSLVLKSPLQRSREGVALALVAVALGFAP